MLETLHCLHGALRVRFRVLTVALQALVLSSLSTFWHFLHHSGLLSVPLTQSSLMLLGLHAGVYSLPAGSFIVFSVSFRSWLIWPFLQKMVLPNLKCKSSYYFKNILFSFNLSPTSKKWFLPHCLFFISPSRFILFFICSLSLVYWQYDQGLFYIPNV